MTSGNRFLMGVLLLHFALPSVALAVRTGGESADALYERAVATAQEGRYWAAAGLFDEAVTRFPVGHPLHALAIYGAARANQKLDTPEAACKAIDRFGEFLAQPKIEKEKRRIAKDGVENLTPKCDRETKDTSNPFSGSPEREFLGASTALIILVGLIGIGIVAVAQ